MPPAKKGKKVEQDEGDELKRQFWLIVAIGVIVTTLIGKQTVTKRKKKIKRSEYYSPQQFLYRRRIKKARRWARYGTESWLREKIRKAKYNIQRGY